MCKGWCSVSLPFGPFLSHSLKPHLPIKNCHKLGVQTPFSETPQSIVAEMWFKHHFPSHVHHVSGYVWGLNLDFCWLHHHVWWLVTFFCWWNTVFSCLTPDQLRAFSDNPFSDSRAGRLQWLGASFWDVMLLLFSSNVASVLTCCGSHVHAWIWKAHVYIYIITLIYILLQLEKIYIYMIINVSVCQ